MCDCCDGEDETFSLIPRASRARCPDTCAERQVVAELRLKDVMEGFSKRERLLGSIDEILEGEKVKADDILSKIGQLEALHASLQWYSARETKNEQVYQRSEA